MVDTTSDNQDLELCAREQIHLLGRVQSFGCLLAVTYDWRIKFASESLAEHFGIAPEDAFERSLNEILTEQVLHDLRSRLQMAIGNGAVERLFGVCPLPGDGRLFDVAIHAAGELVVIEFEPHRSAGKSAYTNDVRSMISRLKQSETSDALCKQGVRMAKALTGFDRVMIYRFQNDGTGEVVAEAKRPDLEPFMGLHYPAADIPPQARALYTKNLLRVIADVEDEPSPIRAASSMEDEHLDLSMSTLRAVSEIHIEYLQNMGVAASMSISLLVGGKLWGLIACHNDTPIVPSFELRTACELFGEMMGFLIEQSVSEELGRLQDRAHRLHRDLIDGLETDATVDRRLEAMFDAVSEVLACDAIAASVGGVYAARGPAPTREEFDALTVFLNGKELSEVYATNRLWSEFPAAAEFEGAPAGLLAMPASRSPRDYVVAFRREESQTITWAGEPAKLKLIEGENARISPRKSFAAWEEEVRGRSREWHEGERRAAEVMRISFLEVVLRISEAVNQERLRSHEQQEVLIAELNHRVRNILGLVRGLLTQNESGTGSVADFVGDLDGRLQALALAHDQLAATDGSVTSLKAILQAETAVYANGAADKVGITGPDVELSGAALTCLALVFHEMVTNAAKYGALSIANGQVDIVLEHAHGQDLRVRWRERGGPAVEAPRRRGFGSTIIERSIPFELGGHVEFAFAAEGVCADFTIPASFVSHRSDAAPVEADQPVAREAVNAASLSATKEGAVLVVEDNMLISMDIESILLDLGADHVAIAKSVAEAEEEIAAGKVKLAILDVSLGSETSEGLADTLAAAGTPFLFSTGYGEATGFLTRFSDVPVLRKPFNSRQLQDAIGKALGSKP